MSHEREITIKQYVGEGVVQEIITVYPSADSVHKIELQKTDNITLKFNLAEPIVIERGMFIEWDGVTYFVNNTFKPTYNATNGAYAYSIQFDAWYFFWNRYLLVLNPEKGANETAFTYTSAVEEIFKIIYDNLEMYHYGNAEKEIVADESVILPNPKCVVHFVDGSVVTYGYDTEGGVRVWKPIGTESYHDEMVEPNTQHYVENKAVLYTFDAVHLTDALTTIAKAAECEWWMEDNTIHFGRCIHLNEKIEKERRGKDYEQTFFPEWHLGSQYENMTRNQSSQAYATRVFAFGSNTNIPARYRRSLIFTPTDFEDVQDKNKEQRCVIPATTGKGTTYTLCVAVEKKHGNMILRRDDVNLPKHYGKIFFYKTINGRNIIKTLSAFEINISTRLKQNSLFPLGYGYTACVNVKVSIYNKERVYYTNYIDFSYLTVEAGNPTIQVPQIEILDSASVDIKLEITAIFAGLVQLVGLLEGYYGTYVDMSRIEMVTEIESLGEGVQFYDATRKMVDINYFQHLIGRSQKPFGYEINVFFPGLGIFESTNDRVYNNYIADYNTNRVLAICEILDYSRVEIKLQVDYEIIVKEEATFSVTIQASLWENLNYSKASDYNFVNNTISIKGINENDGERLESYKPMAGWTFENQKGHIKIDEDIHDIIQTSYPYGILVVTCSFVPEDQDKYWSDMHPFNSYENPDKYRLSLIERNLSMSLLNRGAYCRIRFSEEDATLYANGVTDYNATINPRGLSELDENLQWTNVFGDTETLTGLKNLLSHHCNYHFAEEDVYEYLVPISYFTDNYKISATRADYKKSLMLPTPESIENDETLQRYLSENDFVLTDRNCLELKGVHPSQFLEAQVKFENIYPNQRLTIRKIQYFTDNETNTDEAGQTYHTKIARYRFFIHELEFPFKTRYILPEQNLKVRFQTGRLAGMEFDIDFEGNSFATVDGEYEGFLSYLIMTEEEGGIRLPNEELCPQEGDVVVFLNYDVAALASLGVVLNAEKELLVETIKHLKKIKEENSTLTATLSSMYAQEVSSTFASKFQLGDVVKVYNKGYYPTSKNARIQSIETKLDIPWHSPKFQLGDASSYSRLSAMEGTEQSSSVAVGLNIGQGNGSGGATIKDVILTGKDYFLSKKEDDVAEGNITFKQSVNVGQSIEVGQSVNVGRNLLVKGSTMIDQSLVAKGNVGSDAFTTGMLGMGWRINRLGEGEMDSLILRKKLVVPELQFNRVSVEAGVRWQVSGGGKIKKVVPDTDENGNMLNSGQIYLDLEDGEMGTLKLYDKCQGVYHRKSTAKVFPPSNSLSKSTIENTGVITIDKGDISILYNNGAEPYVFRATKDFSTKVITDISKAQKYYAVVVEGMIDKEMYVVLNDSFPQSNQSVLIENPTTSFEFTQYIDTGINQQFYKLLDRCYAVETPFPDDLWELVGDEEANAKANEDFRNTNFAFSGFTSIYFIITEICADDAYNGHLKYQLRCEDEPEYYNAKGKYSYLKTTVPQALEKIESLGLDTIAKVYKAKEDNLITEEEWNMYLYWKDRDIYADNTHPQENMSVAAYANHVESERQQCYYETTRYGVEMVNMVDWISRPENVIYVERELEGFTVPIREWGTGEYKYYKLNGWGLACGNTYHWGSDVSLDRPASIVSQQLEFTISNIPLEEVQAYTHEQIDAMGWLPITRYTKEFKLTEDTPYLYERWRVQLDNGLYDEDKLYDVWLEDIYDDEMRNYSLVCDYAAVNRIGWDEYQLVGNDGYFETSDEGNFMTFGFAITCKRYNGVVEIDKGYLCYTIDGDLDKEYEYTRPIVLVNATSKATFYWYDTKDKETRTLWRTQNISLVEDGWTLTISRRNTTNLPRNETDTFTAIVRSGGKDITWLFEDKCFTWYRISGQSEQAMQDDLEWAERRKDDLHSKTLVVGDDDLYKFAEFKCKFNDGRKTK